VTLVAELPLKGAGGEPVDFARTMVSHGVAELRPWPGNERHRCSQTIRKIRGPLEGGPLIG
jgi:hypothetical protein